MGTANCDNCTNEFTFDSIPRRGMICFRCHVKTVNLGFSEGKETFHGPTVGERQREIETDAKNNGYQVERVGERWV